MLLIKNPWGHFRWQGKYSFGDTKNWTAQLKQALGYSNFTKDQGVFWMDFDSVIDWFTSLDINWNPELLLYRKSFFDHWQAKDMLGGNSLSLKDNPQYFIDFMADAAQTAAAGQTFVCWVVISKLLVMHKDGSAEDEENSKDYMALHVYKNKDKGQKVLEDRHCLKRSTYSPEQTTMLYLNLPSADHLQVENVLNLVLDQHKRERDLFYNIRVYSSVPFVTGRSGMSFKFKQEVIVPQFPGGGVPSSTIFYKNPQFMISTDR